MHINLGHTNGSKKLPKDIQKHMMRKFKLSSENLELLRCFEYEGKIRDKQVRRISIFSPKMAQENHLSIKTRQDLKQHIKMLLFEGYTDSQGNIYVADRRTPIARPKAIQKS